MLYNSIKKYFILTFLLLSANHIPYALYATEKGTEDADKENIKILKEIKTFFDGKYGKKMKPISQLLKNHSSGTLQDHINGGYVKFTEEETELGKAIEKQLFGHRSERIGGWMNKIKKCSKKYNENQYKKFCDEFLNGKNNKKNKNELLKQLIELNAKLQRAYYSVKTDLIITLGARSDNKPVLSGPGSEMEFELIERNGDKIHIKGPIDLDFIREWEKMNNNLKKYVKKTDYLKNPKKGMKDINLFLEKVLGGPYRAKGLCLPSYAIFMYETPGEEPIYQYSMFIGERILKHLLEREKVINAEALSYFIVSKKMTIKYELKWLNKEIEQYSDELSSITEQEVKKQDRTIQNTPQVDAPKNPIKKVTEDADSETPEDQPSITEQEVKKQTSLKKLENEAPLDIVTDNENKEPIVSSNTKLQEDKSKNTTITLQEEINENSTTSVYKKSTGPLLKKENITSEDKLSKKTNSSKTAKYFSATGVTFIIGSAVLGLLILSKKKIKQKEEGYYN